MPRFLTFFSAQILRSWEALLTCPIHNTSAAADWSRGVHDSRAVACFSDGRAAGSRAAESLFLSVHRGRTGGDRKEQPGKRGMRELGREKERVAGCLPAGSLAVICGRLLHRSLSVGRGLGSGVPRLRGRAWWGAAGGHPGASVDSHPHRVVFMFHCEIAMAEKYSFLNRANTKIEQPSKPPCSQSPGFRQLPTR